LGVHGPPGYIYGSTFLCNDSDLHKSILTGCVTQLVSAKNGGSHSPDLVCISWLLKRGFRAH